MSSSPIPETSSQTLYDILGAPPTSSTAELKKRYFRLARLFHPDANCASDGDKFSEIAAAWNVLGDPKRRRRYDRELRAKAFTEMASKYTNEGLELAVPALADMMDRFAMPFAKDASTWSIASILSGLRVDQNHTTA